MKNIFLTEGTKGQLIKIIYDMLMTRKEITYHDVYLKYKPFLPADYFEKHSLGRNESSQMKKAFMDVRNALNEKVTGCIKTGKKGRSTTYRYDGGNDNPLFEEMQVFAKKSLQDYVNFCKESLGLLPVEWFSHFFENTQLLLDSRRDREKGNIHIESGFKQVLRGIERLPMLYEHITKYHVLSFVYHPYGKDPLTIIMHPHFLKEYNGRWFLFGYIDRSTEVSIFALDRIETEPQIVAGIEYMPAPVGTYKEFFANIVGVSHEKDTSGVENVVIRTQSLYMHELMKSKKLHYTQKEIKAYGAHEDGTYGEFELYVEHNRELRGKILAYGEGLKGHLHNRVD